MSNKPRDPAQGAIDQNKSHEDSLQGQEGYGVDYQDERFTGEDVQQAPATGRSGSYEAENTGGYGTSHQDAEGQRAAHDRPVTLPDAEAQQGQGGQ